VIVVVVYAASSPSIVVPPTRPNQHSNTRRHTFSKHTREPKTSTSGRRGEKRPTLPTRFFLYCGFQPSKLRYPLPSNNSMPESRLTLSISRSDQMQLEDAAFADEWLRLQDTKPICRDMRERVHTPRPPSPKNSDQTSRLLAGHCRTQSLHNRRKRCGE